MFTAKVLQLNQLPDKSRIEISWSTQPGCGSEDQGGDTTASTEHSTAAVSAEASASAATVATSPLTDELEGESGMGGVLSAVSDKDGDAQKSTLSAEKESVEGLVELQSDSQVQVEDALNVS